jgi:hypothetical protein
LLVDVTAQNLMLVIRLFVQEAVRLPAPNQAPPLTAQRHPALLRVELSFRSPIMRMSHEPVAQNIFATELLTEEQLFDYGSIAFIYTVIALITPWRRRHGSLALSSESHPAAQLVVF